MVKANLRHSKQFSLRQSVVAIAGILCILLLPHTGWFPFFSYAVLLTAMIWMLLRFTNENFASLGFGLANLNFRALAFGGLAAIIYFLVMEYGFFPLLKKIIPLPAPNLDDFKSIRGNTGNYVFILVMGWVVGGFYEELAFHGYLFTRIEKWLGNSTVASLLITNILFSLYHFQLGPVGMINAFTAGLAYNALMLKAGRNMWYSFFFHGFFDTIGLTYIYLGYW
jgi:membrane protease YdiL (CAAX protease family)